MTFFLVLAFVSRAAHAMVPQLCPQRAASDYILDNYPDPAHPSFEAFEKLSEPQKKELCETVRVNLGRRASSHGQAARASNQTLVKAMEKFAKLQPAVSFDDPAPQPAAVPVAQAPAPRALSVSKASLTLMSHYNDPYPAWDKVTQTRNPPRNFGDLDLASEHGQQFLRDRDELQALVGGLKDPRQDPSIDGRLRDIQHYIVAFDEVQSFARPYPNDSFFKKTGKTIVRETVAAPLVTLQTAAYTGFKALVQLLPFDTSITNSNTSKADLKEVWAGVQGAWSGAFRLDYGPRQPPADRSVSRHYLSWTWDKF